MRTLEQAERLSSSDRELLQEVKQVICGLFPAATVLLYGSVARGTRTAESDYDILVLMDHAPTQAEKDRARDALFDLGLERGAVISTIFYAESDWDSPLYRAMPLHCEVDRDAVLI